MTGLPFLFLSNPLWHAISPLLCLIASLFPSQMDIDWTCQMPCMINYWNWKTKYTGNWRRKRRVLSSSTVAWLKEQWMGHNSHLMDWDSCPADNWDARKYLFWLSLFHWWKWWILFALFAYIVRPHRQWVLLVLGFDLIATVSLIDAATNVLCLYCMCCQTSQGIPQTHLKVCVLFDVSNNVITFQ